jgi:hypothetical protein
VFISGNRGGCFEYCHHGKIAFVQNVQAISSYGSQSHFLHTCVKLCFAHSYIQFMFEDGDGGEEWMAMCGNVSWFDEGEAPFRLERPVRLGLVGSLEPQLSGDQTAGVALCTNTLVTDNVPLISGSL